MPLTPETLTRHELNGLPVRVVDADNPDLVGIGGRVAIETMQTLHVDAGGRPTVESDGSRVRQVPKRGTTFEFALPDGECGSEDADGEPSARATDEAAGDRRETDNSSGLARRDRKAPGSASELGSDTAGVRSGQSGPSAPSGAASRQTGECEGAVYVTVDGARLLSRPALRTERAGDSTWR